MVDVMRRLLRHPSGVVGLVLLLLALIVMIGGPALAPYDPEAFHAAFRFRGPSLQFPLGTDQFGRDLLSRVLSGARFTILFGLAATGLGGLVGVTIGLISGYRGGLLDEVAMRLVEAFLSIPSLLFAVLILTVLGGGTLNGILAVAITIAPPMARITRAVTLAVRERDFVSAAMTRGESTWFILLYEIMPNLAAPIVVEATIRIAFAIMAGATLSFLGLGARPPASDWGLMIADARSIMQRNPWLVIGPGAGIAIVAIGFNLFGDALRDALNPRLRR
jgi:peptide/nickel transport system permease protein